VLDVVGEVIRTDGGAYTPTFDGGPCASTRTPKRATKLSVRTLLLKWEREGWGFRGVCRAPAADCSD
jgi:hypothetical protein